ncbi:preprotein translocase subunit SecG [Thiomonas bhubaneswarensis]|uniref:Protein-export membrane protein SecG n=1 Tax=Thiomonas bhubaneswarensis TaxID=339866 RepID=A0A0K6I4M3_9BURK|nr:preprotein translocase subunit SecG [Thiomonas bhubaneswarensis]CUA98013.1 protein translocase subunit secG [Thiomonas bhubaneswarensis]
MQILMTLTLVVQILSALVMIVLVLMQHGKGADMGASFGSGASGSLFGATGSANFLSRSTAVAATLFFVATLMMAYFGNRANSGDGGLMEKLAAPAPVASVAAPSKPAGPISEIPGVPGASDKASKAAAPATSAASAVVPAKP